MTAANGGSTSGVNISGWSSGGMSARTAITAVMTIVTGDDPSLAALVQNLLMQQHALAHIYCGQFCG
jgi:hypothetical protein